ncbi:hypothetical protein ACFYW8_43920 [Streptomyces sp. NPDC002742]|uniref:hypothetical protein n=1 Tax=Streptomyces sp. NPDC002742 TaxID=3364663 RepID=UPI00368B9AD9
MNDRRPEGPGKGGGPTPKPIPRDLPDQQAAADEDPWDVVGAEMQSTLVERAEPQGPDPEIPDTDEVGTGRKGAPQSGSPHPEHPVPDEPSA